MLQFCNPSVRRLLALALAVGWCGLNLQPATADPPRPNVVLIVADDFGWGELNANIGGRPFGRTISTPNLDALAAGGLRFTNFYSCGTVCTPSRMGLLTGLDTSRSLSRGNAETVLRPESVTIGNVMQDAGYSTHAFGKWGVGGVQPGTAPFTDPPPVFQNAFALPTERGFDSYAGIVDTLHAWNYWSSYVWQGDSGNPMSAVTIPGNVGVDQATGPTPAQLADGAINVEDIFRNGAVDVINNSTPGGDPFFTYVPFITPHRTIASLPIDPLYATAGTPGDALNPNGGAWSTIEKQYASAMTAFDQRVGDIVQALSDRGILDNTLILITGDNGPQQTEGHQVEFFDSNGELRGFKRSMYDGGIRTPMVAYWNGTVAPGVSDYVGTHADLMPTLAALAGGASPTDINGISFADHLLGGTAPTRGKPLYFEFYEGGFVQAARQDNWKMVRTAAGNYELYDLNTDPSETNNLAANPSYSAVRDQLKTFLEDSRNYTLQYQPHYSQTTYNTLEDTGGVAGVREFELRLAGDAVRVGPGMGGSDVSQYDALSHAIEFSGNGKAHSKGASVGGEPGGLTIDNLAYGSSSATTNPASFELWFKPSDLAGQEIVAELGGVSRGLSFLLDGDELKFRVKDGANLATLSKDLGSGAGAPGEGTFGLDNFNQLVGVIDVQGSGANLALFLNGVKVDDQFLAGLTDWAGGDGDALGGLHNSLGGNNGDLNLFGGFDGQIALFRIYEFAMQDHQVMQRYWQIAAIPEPSSLALILCAAAGCCRSRRRRVA
ncbi:MAG: sulfatase-like hydrolase/transferase [Pirellulaceae bacterium]|nr:sulfatase-like hydrolase/transferase [Pirellulaceae bacterium]